MRDTCGHEIVMVYILLLLGRQNTEFQNGDYSAIKIFNAFPSISFGQG